MQMQSFIKSVVGYFSPPSKPPPEQPPSFSHQQNRTEETDYSVTEIIRILEKEAAEFRTIDTCNVLIAGHSGAGKSSLINTVFGKELEPTKQALTGAGKPQTQCSELYKTERGKVRLYDTKGLESGQSYPFELWKKDLEKLIAETQTNTQERPVIHLVWYLVDAGTARVFPEDESCIQYLQKKYPLLVVVNKVDLIKQPALIQLQTAIKQLKTAPLTTVLTSAVTSCITNIKCQKCGRGVVVDFELNQMECKGVKCENNVTQQIPPDIGISDLIDASFSLLPEVQKRTWAAAQQYSVSVKDKTAFGYFLDAYNQTNWSTDAYAKSLVIVIDLAKLFTFDNWGQSIRDILRHEEDWGSLSLSFFKAKDYISGVDTSKYYMCAKLMFWYIQFRHQFLKASQLVGDKELGALPLIPPPASDLVGNKELGALPLIPPPASDLAGDKGLGALPRIPPPASDFADFISTENEQLLKTKLPSLSLENSMVSAIMSQLSNTQPIDQAIEQTFTIFKDKAVFLK